jgi:hypothetical protein
VDEVAVGLVTAAWHDDPDSAWRWFDLVCRVREGLPGDAGSSEFRRAIVEAGAEEAVPEAVPDQFFAYLEESGADPVEVTSQWAATSPDALLQIYLSAGETAATSAPGVESTDDGTGLDPFMWQAYLTQWHGGWDGAEETWPQFAESFRYHAPDGAADAANDLLAYAESQPNRAEVLATYGICVPAPEATPAEPTTAGQPAGDEIGSVAAELVDDVALPVLELFLAQNPQYADLPPERLVELLGEVLVEQLTPADA